MSVHHEAQLYMKKRNGNRETQEAAGRNCRRRLTFCTRASPSLTPARKSYAEASPAATTITHTHTPLRTYPHHSAMATPIPSPSALRALRALSTNPTPIHTQVRHATLLRRPKRPYTFTQLVTLSDGSTFVQRTTSPAPVYKATKDTRNTPLWNPSSQKLLNVEEDEAGKLAAFRAKFGRGWDAEQVREWRIYRWWGGEILGSYNVLTGNRARERLRRTSLWI